MGVTNRHPEVQHGFGDLSSLEVHGLERPHDPRSEESLSISVSCWINGILCANIADSDHDGMRVACDAGPRSPRFDHPSIGYDN